MGRSRSIKGGAGASRAAATAVILLGSLLTFTFLPAVGPIEMFRWSAWTMAIALVVAVLIESKGRGRALPRADVVILLCLYGLTFAEFLLPDTTLMLASFGGRAEEAVFATLTGTCAVAVGRHLFPISPQVESGDFLDLSSQAVAGLLIGTTVLGLLHIFVSTDFNLGEIIAGLGNSRWERPWARGRIGGLYSLLYELHALLYVVPALSGIVLARRNEYPAGVAVVARGCLALSLVYAFTLGTRNVFVVFILLYVSSSLLARRRLSKRRVFLTLLVAGLLLGFGSAEILRFRDIGISRYIAGYGQSSQVGAAASSTTMVDNNLFAIAGLIDAFPARHDYLGAELVVYGALLPIPRAIWAGKPDKISVDTAEALGTSGLSIASTIVGEGYMSAGYLGVILFGLCYGAIGGWWNRFGFAQSSVGLAFYAAGFLALAVGTRSVLFLFVGFLPSLFIWLVGRYLVRRRRFNQPVALRRRTGRRAVSVSVEPKQ